MEPSFKWKGKALFVRIEPEDVIMTHAASQCWVSSNVMDRIKSSAPKSLGEEEEPDVYVTVAGDRTTETFKVDVPIVFAGGDCLLFFSKITHKH